MDNICLKTFTWYARICSSPYFSGGLPGGPPSCLEYLGFGVHLTEVLGLVQILPSLAAGGTVWTGSASVRPQSGAQTYTSRTEHHLAHHEEPIHPVGKAYGR